MGNFGNSLGLGPRRTRGRDIVSSVPGSGARVRREPLT
jgi:hypothetical protein